jgi:hypothetical protein
LFTGLAFFVPLPDFGTSVHISFTFSRTILQCRSNAFTRANILWLFRQFIRTCVSWWEPKAREKDMIWDEKQTAQTKWNVLYVHYLPVCSVSHCSSKSRVGLFRIPFVHPSLLFRNRTTPSSLLWQNYCREWSKYKMWRKWEWGRE